MAELTPEEVNQINYRKGVDTGYSQGSEACREAVKGVVGGLHLYQDEDEVLAVLDNCRTYIGVLTVPERGEG